MVTQRSASQLLACWFSSEGARAQQHLQLKKQKDEHSPRTHAALTRSSPSGRPHGSCPCRSCCSGPTASSPSAVPAPPQSGTLHAASATAAPASCLGAARKAYGHEAQSKDTFRAPLVSWAKQGCICSIFLRRHSKAHPQNNDALILPRT